MTNVKKIIGGMVVVAPIAIILALLQGGEAEDGLKVGDIPQRKGCVEITKAEGNKLTAKVYTVPQWKDDGSGEPFIKFDEETEKIYCQAGYVQFVPDATTKKLPSSREIYNSSIKEYYTIPDMNTTKLTWEVKVDGTIIFDDKSFVLTFQDSLGAYMFDVSPPTAWDADNKPVIVEVKYDKLVLTYTIKAGIYRYPVTVDPNVVVAKNSNCGYLTAFSTIYMAAHDTTATGNPNSGIRVGQSGAGAPTFRIDRTFLNFTIPELISCSACTLWAYGNTDASTTAFGLQLYGASSARPVLGKPDFPHFSNHVASGFYDSTDVLNFVWNSESFLGTWNAIIFNSTGLDSMVVASGDTLWLVMLSNRDVAATASAGNEYLTFEFTSYLSFTYATSSPTIIPRIMNFLRQRRVDVIPKTKHNSRCAVWPFPRQDRRYHATG